MKQWMVAAMLIICGTMAAQTSQTVKDDLFNGTEMFAKGASDVTEVTMDPDTLGMVGGKDKEKARRTVLSVVRTYTYDKPGMYRIEDVDAFRNKLNTGDWHCSVHTRSLKTGESTDVCNKRRSDDLTETAIITVEPKELTFIHTIRRGGGGSLYTPLGEMGMPFLPVHGMANLAMLDPEAMVNMKIAMARMPAMMAEAQAGMSAAMPGMMNGDAQRRIAEGMKALHDAESQKHTAPSPEYKSPEYKSPEFKSPE